MSDLVPKPYELTDVGLIVHSHINFDTWEKLGHYLVGMSKGSNWFLGDWINAGENLFGEKYTQALDATNYNYQTLRQFAWVSRKVEYCNRRKDLTFGHHAEVAMLTSEKQRFWLQVAFDEDLRVHDLRYRIQGGVVTPIIGQAAPKEIKLRTPLDDIKAAFTNLKAELRMEFLAWANDLMAG